MTSVLDAMLECVRGAVEISHAQTGIVLHRTSARSRVQYGDVFLDFADQCPSGVRFDCMTDADYVEFTLRLTRITMGPAPTPPVLDVIIDEGEAAAFPADSFSVVTLSPGGAIDINEAPPSCVRIPLTSETQGNDEGLGRPGAKRRVQIWLPANAITEILDITAEAGASFAPFESAAPTWIHYGSSISHCQEVERPTQTWPALVARRAGFDLVNLALAGNCHTDQAVARTIRDWPEVPAAVSLKLGINTVQGVTMTKRVFRSAVEGFLDTLREGLPEVPIILASPIYCPPLENAPGPTVLDDNLVVRLANPEQEGSMTGGFNDALTLVGAREILSSIVQRRHAQGDTHLHYLDGLELFGPDDADLLPDDLHPNEEGYARIAARFYDYACASDGPFTHVHP